MKILRPSPKFTEQEIICETCEALLLVEVDDLKFERDDDVYGYSDPYFYVECAECGEVIHINKDLIPPKTRKKLRGW